MADNLTTPISAGTILAADEIAGILFQRIKLAFGVDGVATDVSAAAPLPVALSGGATAANQTTGNSSLASIATATAAAAPAADMFAITPSDSAALAVTPRAIYVGVTGDITVRKTGSTTDILFKSVPAGSILPISPQYVRATGTGASQLVGLA